MLLSIKVIQQYKALFKYIQVLIIDGIGIVIAELLLQIDSKLKQINDNYDTNFGRIEIIIIGDNCLTFEQLQFMNKPNSISPTF